jgi:uncharacterized membrane protein
LKRRPVGYWPLAAPFLIGLFVLALLAVAFVEVGVISYAYQQIGIPQGWLYTVLLGSVIGSHVNIPVARFPDHTEMHDTDVSYFGVRHRVPIVVPTGETTLAVNVGGALIPGAVAVYLVVHNHLWLRALIAVVVVAIVVWLVARPVRGIGIVTPPLVPPVAAAGVATIVGGHAVAALAYVCGTLGTLVGADLLNLRRIRDLGAPLASIGGAGTFDGIFLTGILAVLLAGS